MSIIKMIIQYKGTHFYGWQRQSNSRSVQGEIEKVLSKILKTKITIDGAGRTDAGVHAFGQVATFDFELPMTLDRLKKALNNMLPSDIGVTSLYMMPDDFHARYSAKGKTYEYRVYNARERSVFDAEGTCYYPYDLCDELIVKACEQLIGTHNFDSFKATGSSAQNPIRTIHDITFIRKGPHITFTFTGDGFLYKMVRLLVGFLLEVGNKRVDHTVLATILMEPSRQYTTKVAPACGLYLKEVFY